MSCALPFCDACRAATSLRVSDRVEGYFPTCPIVLARRRQVRRAGTGILIEGCPPGEMHHAVIWLVDRERRRPLDVAPKAGLGHTLPPGLEWAGDATGH